MRWVVYFGIKSIQQSPELLDYPVDDQAFMGFIPPQYFTFQNDKRLIIH